MAAETDWFDQGLSHIWLPYAQMKTAVRPEIAISAKGAHIRLADGRTLVDGIGSWWTAVHGYNHPGIVQAMRAQLERMPHIMLGGLAHEPAYRLATRLAAMTPQTLSKTFFTESGSVAVEVAMKIAVQYWRNLGVTGRSKFVSFKGGYHGDTFATMAVCDPEEGMHTLFADALPKHYTADLPTDEASLSALSDILSARKDVAALIVEPLLQGAGGMLIHNEDTLREMRALCDRHNILLIFDEIFTGFGRTGAMFAADRAGVCPDIMTLGKALTGGSCPLAATIATDEVYAAFHADDPHKALMHGPTYSGHALACAAANASLDLFKKEPRLKQVAAIERSLGDAFLPLRALQHVRDVRVIGAVGAVEMKHPFNIEQARAEFIKDGVFIRPIGKVIYLTPAYTIDEEDLRILTNAVIRRVEALATR